jgi:hypothetical protein
MKKLLPIFLLFATAAMAQVLPTPIRSVSTLPATCHGGSATGTSDEVMLITAGVGALYTCTAPNTWTAAGSGTITGVTAGTGASGGGSSGNVTINVTNPVPTGVANGSALVSNGVSQPGVYQSKPVIDVRDFGVTCNIANDDTAHLNAAFTALGNYGTLLIPNNCPIKITSTITVLQKFGIDVEVQQQNGGLSTTNNSGLFWFGPVHGTMLYLNQVHGSEWHHMNLECSGANTGFIGVVGCNVAVLIDEPATGVTVTTTDTAFFDLSIYNQFPNPSFVGVQIGLNAPGNVENNYFYNAKVYCGGPASGNTDAGFLVGGGASQPNNTTFVGGGPSNCGRGFWIIGNVVPVDIGNMAFGSNYNSLYLIGGDNINYHDIVDQTSVQPIYDANGADLILRNINHSGTTTGPEINIPSGNPFVVMENDKFSGGGVVTLSVNAGLAVRFNELNTRGTDSTFCSVVGNQNGVAQFLNYSKTCQLNPLGTVERTNAVGPQSGYDMMWPDSTNHRWMMSNNGGTNQKVAGFLDNLSVFASGGNISVNTITSTVATGTAPIIVTSTTPVNLNISGNAATATALATTPTLCSTGQAPTGILVSGNATGCAAPVGTSGPFSGTYSCVNLTPVTVSANVATDQLLMACTIPAGTLNSLNRVLRIKADGLYSTPALSTSQMTMSAKLCTVSGCGSGTVITLAAIQSGALGSLAVTNNAIQLSLGAGVQTAGASSVYETHGSLLIDLGAATTAADSVYADTNTAVSSAINSTVQLFLQITGAFSSASASNSMTERMLTVDSVN